MKITLTICGILIGLISLIHFYWVLGGKKGIDASIPGKSNGSKAFMPPVWMTFVVAIIFSTMSAGLIGVAGWFELPISAKTQKYLVILVGVVFMLRSLGDFKYFGFFRKSKNTVFDYWDRKLYTPGTFLIGTSILISTIWYL